VTDDDAIQGDRRDLQRGIAVNALGHVLKAAHPVLLVLLVRAYGAESFGLFLSVQAVLFVLTRVCVLGLDKALLWWVPQQAPGQRLRGMRAAILRAAAIASVLTLVCMLAAHPIAQLLGVPSSGDALRVMSLALLPMTLLELALGATMGTRRMGTNVLVRETMVPIALVGFGLALWPLGLGVTGLGLAMVLSYVIGLAVASVSARKIFAADAMPSDEWRIPAPIWAYAWPMWLAEMANTSLQRLDMWAVAALTDMKTVGIYGVVLQFGNTIRAIRRSFDPIVLAITARIGVARDTERLAAGYSYATAMVIGTQLPLLAFFIVFAPDLLALYGQEFVVGVNAVVILSGFWVVNSAMSLSGIVVSAYGHSRLALYNTLGAALLQIILLWLLVPMWGLEGATLAVGVTYSVLSIAQVIQMRVITKGFHYRRDTGQTLLLGAVSGTALLLGWATVPHSDELWVRVVLFAACGAGYAWFFLSLVRRRADATRPSVAG
jgi:O-antigen/teichoic acid export membrane protein